MKVTHGQNLWDADDDIDEDINSENLQENRNLKQVYLMLEIMRQHKLLGEFCYVEFGAGKGLFSHLVAEENKKFANYFKFISCTY